MTNYVRPEQSSGKKNYPVKVKFELMLGISTLNITYKHKSNLPKEVAL